MQTQTLQSERGRAQSVLEPRGSPDRDCRGRGAVLGASAPLGPHPHAMTHWSLRGGGSRGSSSREHGCKEPQADASPAHHFLQGCGLHPL